MSRFLSSQQDPKRPLPCWAQYPIAARALRGCWLGGQMQKCLALSPRPTEDPSEVDDPLGRQQEQRRAVGLTPAWTPPLVPPLPRAQGQGCALHHHSHAHLCGAAGVQKHLLPWLPAVFTRGSGSTSSQQHCPLSLELGVQEGLDMEPRARHTRRTHMLYTHVTCTLRTPHPTHTPYTPKTHARA